MRVFVMLTVLAPGARGFVYARLCPPPWLPADRAGACGLDWSAPRAAAHARRPGTDIRTVRELLGQSDVSTTMIYTHVLKMAAAGTINPLDALRFGA